MPYHSVLVVEELLEQKLALPKRKIRSVEEFAATFSQAQWR